jgi:molybdate transport system permease protein
MDSDFLETLWVTFKLASLTTLALLIIGLPIARFLAFSKFRFKPFLEALVSMPLVLPPSVIGYYMLLVYSPRFWFGKWLRDTFDIRLAFTFEGVLIASIIFSLPFMIQPLQNGLRSLPESLSEAAYTLGKSKWNTFFKVLLPSIKQSVVTAIALTFAHCIGEFGIVLMVGGSMPGETRVAAIAIYEEVQAIHFDTANRYAFVLFAISFVMLTLMYSFNKKHSPWKMM